MCLCDSAADFVPDFGISDFFFFCFFGLLLCASGAVAVAEFIAESPRLLRLDLRENEIKTGGLMALSLALKVNTSLLRLDLDREPKKETVSTGIRSGEWG